MADRPWAAGASTDLHDIPPSQGGNPGYGAAVLTSVVIGTPEAETEPPRAVALRGPVQTLGALALYLGTSFVFFGVPLMGRFSSATLGGAGRIHLDVNDFVWYMTWWPHAIGNGLNPFFTHLLWAPSGFDLAWTTSIPGPSLLAAPLTLAAGPVVSFNVWSLLAPGLAAWTAFLLCRHLTKAFWPSLVGGYLFGFSSYVLTQLSGHLNLDLVFLLPVFIYLFLLRLEGRLRVLPFVLLLGVALWFQLLTSAEVFLTMTLFGGLAIGVALLSVTSDDRSRLLQTAGLTAAGYALAALLAAPYLYYGFAPGFPRHALFSAHEFSIDLVNFVVPTKITWLGGTQAASITGRFTGNLEEQGGYLGLPLLALIALYAVARWRSVAGRVLLAVFAAGCLLALGPRLQVQGLSSFRLPWTLAVHLPILAIALPSRLMLYVALAAAVMAALWLTAPAATRVLTGGKWMLAALAIAALVPNLSSFTWGNDLWVPQFFASGAHAQYLHPGENVLVIPYGKWAGNPMLWQAWTGMRFRLASGYTGCQLPPEFMRWPIVYTLLYAKPIPSQDSQLRAFLGAHDVGAIIVTARRPEFWVNLFSTLGVQPINVGGVILFEVPPSVLAAYRQAVPPPMRVVGGKLSNCPGPPYPRIEIGAERGH